MPKVGASPQPALGALIECVVAEAPRLVRQKGLLATVDWKSARTDQVERLLAAFDAERLALPAALARALVLAGHAVPAVARQSLAASLRVFIRLRELPAAAALPSDLRADIAALEADDDTEAAAVLAEALAAHGEPALARRIALRSWQLWPHTTRRLRKVLESEIARLPEVAIRVVGFSLTQGLAAALAPAFAALELRAAVSEANFGEVMPELLRPAAKAADAMFLLLDADGLFVPDWRHDAAAVGAALDARLDALASAIEAYAGSNPKPLIVNTLPAIGAPAAGHVDRHHDAGAAHMIEKVNRRLADLARTTSTLQLVDSDLALAAIAPLERRDDKLWYYGRMAYSDPATRALAQAFARAFTAHRRGPAKVLALDFDNTLWGGVYGDDGIDRLACGDDFPGNAFKALQREALRLKAQGMILVGLSKNNADAIEVFARHPGMLLKAEDFAATAIDWSPKPSNIERLAAELNLGLDSFLFLDDSAHEREAMRLMCPAVMVPEMPADPARRPQWLRGLVETWPLRLTREDALRSGMYAAERKARVLRETAATFEDYLASLEQRLTIRHVTPETLGRAAQLHQRTNQFNLTTRRFTEAELAAIMNAPATGLVIVADAVDRFGDHGIIAAAAVSIEGATARIDSLLMSCRVMGRQVETAFLGALVDHLAGRGIDRIEAAYLPTAKNGMVRDFYRSHGFSAAASAGDGTGWTWTRGSNETPRSPYVAVQWREQ